MHCKKCRDTAAFRTAHQIGLEKAIHHFDSQTMKYFLKKLMKNIPRNFTPNNDSVIYIKHFEKDNHFG